MIPKWYPNEPQMIPKRSPTDSQTIPKWFPNSPKIIPQLMPKRFLRFPYRFVVCIKRIRIVLDRRVLNLSNQKHWLFSFARFVRKPLVSELLSAELLATKGVWEFYNYLGANSTNLGISKTWTFFLLLNGDTWRRRKGGKRDGGGPWELRQGFGHSLWQVDGLGFAPRTPRP